MTKIDLKYAFQRMGCGKSNLLSSKSSEKKKIKQMHDADVRATSTARQRKSAKNFATNAKYKARFDGRVTAKYQMKALIGRGSFSKVVRVEHRVTKQPYAIKIIEANDGSNAADTELTILRRVSHKNIVQLYEVFETKARIYMVMELATGGELFDRIVSEGWFTEADAVVVLRMVVGGIRYLHSLGITHRDLKPENLLYYHPGANSKIIITDFGLAHSGIKSSNNNLMSTTCGTPEYIAPEILMRQPYTKAVDVWAVGVITYILLSGTMPFDHENRIILYKKILTANYSFEDEHWCDVSTSAKKFIARLLTLSPTDRPTAQHVLKHHWIVSNASRKKNLHGSISENLKRQSIHSESASTMRAISGRSGNTSAKSLRSEHRRISRNELEALHSSICLSQTS